MCIRDRPTSDFITKTLSKITLIGAIFLAIVAGLPIILGLSLIHISRYIKRGGKVWIKIFPDKPVTEKPAGTRMGSGKGSPEYWVAVVKPGRVLFELADVSEETAREALRLASHKLPVRCKFVKREELDTVKEGDAE